MTTPTLFRGVIKVALFLLGTALFVMPAVAPAQTDDEDEQNGAETPVADDTAPDDTNTTTELPSLPEEHDQATSDNRDNRSPINGNRAKARKIYEKGRKLAVNRAFMAAHKAFKEALRYVRHPIILYAAAQCQRDVGNDIEALYYFNEALNANGEAAIADQLTTYQAVAAFQSMEDLLRRFVAVQIIAPEKTGIKSITIDGELWRTITVAAIAPQMSESRNSSSKNIDATVGLSKARLEELDEPPGAPATKASAPAVFLIKPGNYDLEITLKNGRKMFFDSQQIWARENSIDLRTKNWPSRVVIAEIPPGTEVVLRRGGTSEILLNETTGDTSKNNIETDALTPGEYNLAANRRGFLDFNKTIILGEAQREAVYLDFRPKPLYQKWPFWVGVGLVTAAIVGITIPLILANQDDPPGSGTVNLNRSAGLAVRF